MRIPVYNSAISKMKPATRARIFARNCRAALCAASWLLFPLCALSAPPVNWSEPELQLARKIVAVTGPGPIALTVNNRSSLSKRESEIIGNGLRAALESLGSRFVPADRSAASVEVTLSENQSSYVWVADIRQGGNEDVAVMVSTPLAHNASIARDSPPLELHRTSIWKQSEAILDLAVLEESASPIHIAVLDGERLTLYRWRGTKWDQEQSLAIVHARPWPRDLRGRLILAEDHLLDVYLPGVFCRTTSGLPLALSCRESDDPWPLAGRSSAASSSFLSNGAKISSPLNGFFSPARNFFTGAISPGIGKFNTVPKFYSLAFVPRDKYMLWLFAGLDGQIHIIDGVSDSTIKSLRTKWGSDIASVQTPCGAGWQVLAASSAGEDDDSIRAYEFPDRDPVAVSPEVRLAGELVVLWTESKGDSAIGVVRHKDSREYEALRLAVSCGQ